MDFVVIFREMNEMLEKVGDKNQFVQMDKSHTLKSTYVSTHVLFLSLSLILNSFTAQPNDCCLRQKDCQRFYQTRIFSGRVFNSSHGQIKLNRFSHLRLWSIFRVSLTHSKNCE